MAQGVPGTGNDRRRLRKRGGGDRRRNTPPEGPEAGLRRLRIDGRAVLQLIYPDPIDQSLDREITRMRIAAGQLTFAANMMYSSPSGTPAPVYVQVKFPST